MKTKFFFYSMALALASLFAFAESSKAQTVTVIEDDVTVTEFIPGKIYYYSPSAKYNWYISLGAGAQTFLTEHKGSADYTLAMNFAVGKWFSPNWGLRLSFMGGSIHNHWPTDQNMAHMRYAAAYGDFMWNMFNQFGGYNEDRIFSIIPFVGIGGIYGFHNSLTNKDHDSFAMPVSGGLKLNFRLSHYVDFFLEGRANLMGDNFNKVVKSKQVESIVSAIGGFTYKFGKTRFKGYDPFAERLLIKDLNNKVNDLRGQLQACQSRKCPPCPEIVEAVVVEETTPSVCNTDLTAVVRFTINSSVITNEEMVNVYNIAQWMKANPSCNVNVVGYADKDTGTPKYNMALSKRRAEAVIKVLESKYGINKSRIIMQAMGSDSQAYPNNNNWNRVVVFKGKAQQ